MLLRDLHAVWSLLTLCSRALEFLDNLTTYPLEQQQLLGSSGELESSLRNVEDLYLQTVKTELGQRLSPSTRILLNSDPDFDIVNARYTDYKRPSYVAGVQVRVERDVVETVNYARARGIPFVARTGGHSLTTSMRRIQNAIVIDMRGLNWTRYDVEQRRMTIGGGVTTGEFANATHAQGMEVTVGSCPCTGVMGISLGAGIGRLQGKYGYLNDNMVSARMLLANGTIITVSQYEHPDVFWAIRGAGHNYGIALEATFQVHPQLNGGYHHVVDFEFDLKQTSQVFTIINAIADPLPVDLAMFVIGRKVGVTGGPTLNVNLVYSGSSKTKLQSYLQQFNSIGPVHFDEKVSQWDALPWATYNGLNNILCTPKGWSRFPKKNFYAANVKRYDIPTMKTFFERWRFMNEKHANTSLFSVMFETFPQQRVREIPDNATAFPWRHGADHFLMIEAAYPATIDPALETAFDVWLSAQQDLFIKTSGYGRLQQYVNYGHGSKDPPEALYGYEPWRLERLRRLKRELDPEGLFEGYQPVDE